MPIIEWRQDWQKKVVNWIFFYDQHISAKQEPEIWSTTKYWQQQYDKYINKFTPREEKAERDEQSSPKGGKPTRSTMREEEDQIMKEVEEDLKNIDENAKDRPSRTPNTQ